ncbi:MAG: dipeptidase PepE [Proteobacteria bacterium]|nr:dipeptidase PepE [Pseudomonadota bacterium]
MPELKDQFDKSGPQPAVAAEVDRSQLNLLLLSNGALADKRAEVISELYGASPENPKTILFVAFALNDQDAAAKRMTAWLEPLGIKVISAHTVADPVALLDKVDGVFVTGGNTFRLLDKLQKSGLLEAIKQKALAGMPYMGASAGINVTGPTIMTTNDMPIVQPASFEAMNFVPFQINPHYVDGKFYYEEGGKVVPYQGETRADRINQYHEDNATPVVGVREGSALRIKGKAVEILGGKPVTLFEQGKPAAEITDAKILSSLIERLESTPAVKPRTPFSKP